MPVKGVNKVRANMKRVFKDIEQKKSSQFVQAVLSIGAAHARELTPVEYSNLVNSVTMWVDASQGNVAGTVTYNAEYAAALEFGNWKPRPVNAKEGPAANMNAEPHFLQKGFEDSESQRLIKQAEKIFKF